tara:strand:+ start:271 stop:624 length:354 start_codon:yes stop_codon:yes gene_type:complete
VFEDHVFGHEQKQGHVPYNALSCLGPAASIYGLDKFNYRPLQWCCMPRMVCIDCGAVEYEAASLHAMLVKMMPHYLAVHHDVIAGEVDRPRETWMTRFTQAYRAAETDELGGERSPP